LEDTLVNDEKRVDHNVTDFAAYGLSDLASRLPERASVDTSNTNKIDDEFITDVWRILDSAGNLLIKKHHDYGPKNISLSPGGPLNGLRVRMWDKVARINNLIDSNVNPSNESLRDSFIDLLNYSAIAMMVLDGTWPEE
jgi:hypothetical protein